MHYWTQNMSITDPTDGLLVYRVGGCVRDLLMKLPPADRDYVVVGATIDDMLKRRFRMVGADFPVFLHPVTGEEYALARTERKIAPGYKGFHINAHTGVTLEEDLARRDLTINAIAMDNNDQVIDPFNGHRDLENKLLRHVSSSFREDPVRILRVARFAARYAFDIAPETLDLMCQMVHDGEVDSLVPERVWAEVKKALIETQGCMLRGAHAPALQGPSRFFQVLSECGALERLFPELNALFGVPQPERHHPEIDAGIHTLLALDAAVQLSSDPEVRFAVLLHDLGKGVTPEQAWPSHHGHETAGVPLVETLCKRFKVPAAYRELAKHVAGYHLHAHRALDLKPKSVVRLFKALDALRRPERLEKFLLACQADAIGRAGLQDRPYPQADFLRTAFAAVSAISAKEFIERGVVGPQIGHEMHRQRVQAVRRVKATFMRAST